MAITYWGEPQGEPARLILARHGAVREDWSRRLYGIVDVPLSAKGRAQSHLAAAAVAREQPHLVLTSPLARARFLGEEIAARAGCPLKAMPEWRERSFGAWAGLSIGEILRDHREAYEDFMRRRWEIRVSPDAENMADLAARCVEPLLAQVRANYGRTLVMVSHSGPMRAFLGAILGLPGESLFRIRLDTCSLTRVDFYPDGAIVLRSMNETHHLAGAA
jgi:probable phosphoglycerate mutase